MRSGDCEDRDGMMSGGVFRAPSDEVEGSLVCVQGEFMVRLAGAIDLI